LLEVDALVIEDLKRSCWPPHEGGVYFSVMSPVLKEHFADYGAFHATPGNKACHSVGIPMIFFAVLALLGHVPLVRVSGFTVTLAEPVILAVTLYYLRLDAALGAMMLIVSVIFAGIGRLIPVPAAAALFVLGWVLQFVGHYVYEKKSPAFFRNVNHLLVGPLWILAKATGRG
jgi:uncharacterized membrane protein YGL010W